MLRAYLQLLRPANVATALADVLAGFAIAGLGNRALAARGCSSPPPRSMPAASCSTTSSTARSIGWSGRNGPIPSGRIRTAHAAALGGGLLALGVAAAAAANTTALLVALAIAACVLLYDAWGKRHAAIAPLNMAMCRALNLLLGVAAVPAALAGAWPIAAVPLLYIYAVTAISRGEVHGGSRRAAASALMVLLASLAALLLIVVRAGDRRDPGADPRRRAGVAGRAGLRRRAPAAAAGDDPHRRQTRRAVAGPARRRARGGVRGPDLRGRGPGDRPGRRLAGAECSR